MAAVRYRRISVMLERKGMILDHKKLYLLYSEEGLGVKGAWVTRTDA